MNNKSYKKYGTGKLMVNGGHFHAFEIFECMYVRTRHYSVTHSGIKNKHFYFSYNPSICFLYTQSQTVKMVSSKVNVFLIRRKNIVFNECKKPGVVNLSMISCIVHNRLDRHVYGIFLSKVIAILKNRRCIFSFKNGHFSS